MQRRNSRTQWMTAQTSKRRGRKISASLKKEEKRKKKRERRKKKEEIKRSEVETTSKTVNPKDNDFILRLLYKARD